MVAPVTVAMRGDPGDSAGGQGSATGGVSTSVLNSLGVITQPITTSPTTPPTSSNPLVAQLETDEQALQTELQILSNQSQVTVADLTQLYTDSQAPQLGRHSRSARRALKQRPELVTTRPRRQYAPAPPVGHQLRARPTLPHCSRCHSDRGHHRVQRPGHDRHRLRRYRRPTSAPWPPTRPRSRPTKPTCTTARDSPSPTPTTTSTTTPTTPTPRRRLRHPRPHHPTLPRRAHLRPRPRPPPQRRPRLQPRLTPSIITKPPPPPPRHHRHR